LFCNLLTIRSIVILLAVISSTHLLSPGLASFAESGQHITIEQGLSQSTVQAILQDSQGFMWFGTQDGLNKYDGYKFTVYRRDPARSDTLLANAITALAEDTTDNSLWIAASNGALHRLDRKTEKFERFQYDPNNQHSLDSNALRAVCFGPNGTLWAGTEKGLNRFNRAAHRFERYVLDEKPVHIITTLIEDNEGYLWVGTDGDGLYRVHLATGVIYNFRHNPNDIASIGSNRITSAIISKQGTLYIGTIDGGLVRFDKGTASFYSYPVFESKTKISKYDALAITEDQNGDILVGTSGMGLRKISSTSEGLESSGPSELKKQPIRSLYTDTAGRIWIGTLTSGLVTLDKYRQKFSVVRSVPNQPGTLSHPSVRAFLIDKTGVFWVASDSGLNRWDERSGGFVSYRHDPANSNTIHDNRLRNVLEDSTGRVWAVTWKGVSYYDRASDHFIRYTLPTSLNLNSSSLRVVFEDRKGRLWFGGDQGLLCFNPANKTWTHYQKHPDDANSLVDNRILYLYEDNDGFIWIGTWGGGTSRLQPDLGKFENFVFDANNQNGITSNLAFSFYDDGDSVWIGTSSGGLNCFEKATGRFQSFKTEHGLPNDVVYGILPDRHGRLWFSTNNGLAIFDKKAGVVRTYKTMDGLQSNEFNQGAYYKSASGEMFFGGVNGFNRFYPDQIKQNLHIPPIVFTDFQIDYTSITNSAEVISQKLIRLRPDQRQIRIEFAALDYTAPDKNIYAYKLEGYDRDWVQSGVWRNAVYTNLAPGEYTFRVKGANSDGIWNQEGISLKVVIETPWWMTWWAKIVYFAIVVAIFLGWGLYRTRAERRKIQEINHYNQILELRVQERTREIEAANKQLKQLSISDALTGFHNRAGFNERLLQICSENQLPIAIFICDINGLKKANDTLGHQYGDRLIIAAAEVIANTFDSTSVMARIGGDEFAIATPQCLETHASKLLSYLQENINQYNSVNTDICLSMSAGYEVGDTCPVDTDALYKKADARMYAQKHGTN
jgi:diguanylate cyclase (GGDEF)-like protein